jgi:HEAT repeat protein
VAYGAISKLVTQGSTSSKFLAARLSEVDRAKDPKAVAKWIAKLESEDANDRLSAKRQLRDLGLQGRYLLALALEKASSPDVINTLKFILRDADWPTLRKEDLQVLRAIQALEWIGDANAKMAFPDLFQGWPGIFRDEAKAAVTRLNKE